MLFFEISVLRVRTKIFSLIWVRHRILPYEVHKLSFILPKRSYFCKKVVFVWNSALVARICVGIPFYGGWCNRKKNSKFPLHSRAFSLIKVGNRRISSERFFIGCELVFCENRVFCIKKNVNWLCDERPIKKITYNRLKGNKFAVPFSYFSFI